MAENVEVISFLMGSNKTNGILKWMDNNPDEKFLYISHCYLKLILTVDFRLT